MPRFLIEVAGWTAAFLILLAYGLLSAGKMDGSDSRYHWLNIAAAAGFVVNSGYNGAYPSVVVNVIWIGIALFALYRNRTRYPAVHRD
jgi:hypothetical protein